MTVDFPALYSKKGEQNVNVDGSQKLILVGLFQFTFA
jgi:hypothetical protein